MCPHPYRAGDDFVPATRSGPLMLTLMVNQIAILSMAGLLIWAAAKDALTMTIPNRIVLGVVALYPVWLLTAGTGAAPHWAVAIAVAMLAVGFVGFTYGLVGGGDAKLMAAVVLWAGPAYAVETVAIIAILGGGLAAICYLTLFARRRLCLARGEPVDTQSSLSQQPISYGVAIALGGLYVALRLLAG